MPICGALLLVTDGVIPLTQVMPSSLPGLAKQLLGGLSLPAQAFLPQSAPAGLSGQVNCEVVRKPSCEQQ